ncbi:MAG: motility associated factor glycosyltransferase family protein, partial [Lachnospiraceae bacterium]|nr:motility associated factor glycosyltransferase family protein [Lachnospiraceae bacterium]
LVHNRSINKHIALPKYIEIFPEECDDIVRILNEQYDLVQALSTTLNANSERICKNNIMNMSYLEGCRTAHQYVGAFPKELPAVIVSAGPSLSKNIELLKELKDRAILVVVDTAIPRVIKAGITPDIIISVDFEKSLKHFQVGDLKDIFFVAHIDTNTHVLDFIKPNNIIFNSADSLLWDRLFKEVGSGISEVEAGGSVSTAAIGYMLSWGIKNIILVGQDLALTGNVVHAGEGQTKKEDIGYDTTYVKDVDGNQVLTRKDYCSYIRWIEDLAYQLGDAVNIIDATEGGALIENTKVMTLRAAIDTYCVECCNVREVLESAPRLFVGDDSRLVVDGLENLKFNLRNFKRQFTEVALESHRAAMMLERGEYNTKELKRINALLDKIGNKFLDSEERIYIIKYAAAADAEYSEDIYQVEDDEIKEGIRLYNKSEKYYQTLADAVPKLIEFIDQCLNRIKV